MQADRTPRIEVLLITYNHAQFIEKCLDGLLTQCVDDPIRVIVADDASTDDTVALIKDFERRNSEMRFVYLESQGNVGITKNYQRAFAACSSEYVAVLEGDDYWVNTRKLKTQLEFLELHQEYNVCSANYYVYDEYRHVFTLRSPPGPGHLSLGARELISDNLVGNFSTCMYRKSALDRIPAGVFETKSYDWIINICCGTDGLIAFLNEPMSVYRVHTGGSWNLLSHTEKLQQQLKFIPEYDRLTGLQFSHEFGVLSERLVRAISDSHQRSNEVQDPSPGLIIVPPLSSKLVDCMPPILMSIAKQLLPPAMKRYISKLVFGG